MSRDVRSPSRTALTRWLALLAVLSLTACATLRQLQFERPSVEFDALEIVGLDVEGVSVILWLEVFNPNDFDIRTTRIEADLDLEDTHFGSALWEGEEVLAAASRTTVRIPANFTWEGLGAGARALLGRGSLGYELETRLSLSTSFGIRSVKLTNRGEVPVRD
jgi:LEA14-like dessication related protein